MFEQGKSRAGNTKENNLYYNFNIGLNFPTLDFPHSNIKKAGIFLVQYPFIYNPGDGELILSKKETTILFSMYIKYYHTCTKQQTLSKVMNFLRVVSRVMKGFECCNAPE